MGEGGDVKHTFTIGLTSSQERPDLLGDEIIGDGQELILAVADDRATRVPGITVLAGVQKVAWGGTNEREREIVIGLMLIIDKERSWWAAILLLAVTGKDGQPVGPVHHQVRIGHDHGGVQALRKRELQERFHRS